MPEDREAADAVTGEDGLGHLPRGTLMSGKRGVVMGVANDRSIAWGIAASIAAQGGQLAFTYQGEALGKRVRPLAGQVGSTLVLPCDVGDDAAIDETFRQIEAAWGGIDFLVHAIGWADKQYLRGRYVDTPRDAVPDGARHLGLFLYGGVPARGATDEAGRVAADADLSRSGTLDAALQRHGSGQGGAGGVGALSRGGSGRRTGSG